MILVDRNLPAPPGRRDHADRITRPVAAKRLEPGFKVGYTSDMAKSLLTIGELARVAGVPTSTVRYYEREGILKPRGRSHSNYRLYSQEDVQRLRFIRAAQSTGFTLQDVTELLRPAHCHRVQDLIEERLQTVSTRLKELRHVQRVLRASLHECREHEQTGRCRVIDSLSATSRPNSP